mmetsp:Transcript_3551/g.4054  ORF Transcript_3551/g.4054 Transcript_3551/m.4054 type:complete len:289 (+) Transcript_3551:97-963(+)
MSVDDEADWRTSLAALLASLGWDEAERDATVPVKSIRTLESFERKKDLPLDQYKFETLEKQSVVLFKLGDHDAAIAQLAVLMLKLIRPGVGSAVCVYDYDREKKAVPITCIGTVMIEEDDHAEILLHDNSEKTAALSNIIFVPNNVEQVVGFSKFCARAAKYSMSQNPPHLLNTSFAARSITVAMSLLEAIANDEVREEIWIDSENPLPENKMKTLLISIYMLATRAWVLQCNYHAAAAVLKKAILLDPSNKTARSWVGIIKQRRLKQQLDDKKLARKSFLLRGKLIT